VKYNGVLCVFLLLATGPVCRAQYASEETIVQGLRALDPGYERLKQVTAFDMVIGRLLVWGVKAGVTQDQVEKVFGKPEWVDIGGDVTYWTYLKYGATVRFANPPELPTDPKNRLYGEIQ